MEFFTGLPMDLQITRDEYNLGGGTLPPETLRPQVDALNQNALALARQMQQFMQRVLEDVAACRAITTLYPTQIDHLARELHHYIFRLRSLMSGNTLLTAQEFADEQAFWNEIMAEHAEFIDGLLDPTEQNLKAQAEAFAVEFARLVEQLETAQQRPMMIPQVTLRDEDAMRSLQNFKSQATHGILSAKYAASSPRCWPTMFCARPTTTCEFCGKICSSSFVGRPVNRPGGPHALSLLRGPL